MKMKRILVDLSDLWKYTNTHTHTTSVLFGDDYCYGGSGDNGGGGGGMKLVWTIRKKKISVNQLMR